MRLDSIFKALGVDTVEDIERLTCYFVKDDSTTLTQSRVKLIEDDTAILIQPSEVIAAIKKFADHSRIQKKKEPTLQRKSIDGILIEEDETVDDEIIDDSAYGLNVR